MNRLGRSAGIAAYVFGAACSLAPPPPELVVVSGPGRPSAMLGRHLARTPESFVIVDLGLWVDALLTDELGGMWNLLEVERAELLAIVLGQLGSRLGPPQAGGDPLAGVVAVARALLFGQDGPSSWPGAWLREADAVRHGRAAALACCPGRDVDWSAARKNGAYTSRGELGRLFLTTRYLETCFRHLPAADCQRWVEAVASDQDEERRLRWQRIDAGMASLLGMEHLGLPLLIGSFSPAQTEDRRMLSVLEGSWWQRLEAVHRREMGAGEDLRSAIFRVTHALATEAPDDDWLLAYGLERWRHKWLDLADFAYVAVRETDCIAGALCCGDAERPRLLVEPLPRTLAALKAAFRAAWQAWSVVDGQYARFVELAIASLDDVEMLLQHQREGTDPPEQVVERVWEHLLNRCNGARRPPVETRLEGFAGPVRRSDAYLVRVPIRWQGETHSALAFHYFVECRDEDGVWRRAQRSEAKADGSR